MKFSANRSPLLEALTITGKAIGTGIVPILSSYLFKVSDDKIEITGGSMDIYIKNTIEIPSCGEKIEIAIPKSKLFDLINDSPNQEIEFEVLENKELESDKVVISLKVTTQIGEYLIPIESGTDYPFMKIEDPTEFTISQKDLIAGVESTLFACSDDQLRPATTGVMVRCEGNNITFAATNGFLISVRTITTENAIPLKDSFIIPKKVLSILLSMPKDETVKVLVTKRHIKFSISEDVSIESILIEGDFPAYAGVIPLDNPSHMIIRKAQLFGSVKRVSRFADPGSKVVLDISNSQCKITAENDLGDKAEEILIVDETFGDVKICMSGKLLLLSLGKLDADNILISYNTPNKAMVFHHSDDPTVKNTADSLILIMPMFLD